MLAAILFDSWLIVLTLRPWSQNAVMWWCYQFNYTTNDLNALLFHLDEKTTPQKNCAIVRVVTEEVTKIFQKYKKISPLNFWNPEFLFPA